MQDNPTSNLSSIESQADNQSQQLRAILFLLQSKLDEFKDEVDRSYGLLAIGERTELSKKIERTINDPLDSMFETSSKIEVQVKDLLDKIVRSFLKSQKSVIYKALKNKSASGDLNYSIVLNEDSPDNRMRIFAFYDWLYSFQYEKKFPIVLQIVPTELIDKIKFEAEIFID